MGYLAQGEVLSEEAFHFSGKLFKIYGSMASFHVDGYTEFTIHTKPLNHIDLNSVSAYIGVYFTLKRKSSSDHCTCKAIGGSGSRVLATGQCIRHISRVKASVDYGNVDIDPWRWSKPKTSGKV